jgi:hypothetical protein
VGAALVQPFGLDPVQPTLGGRGQWFDILGLQAWASSCPRFAEAAAEYAAVLLKVRVAVAGAAAEDAALMRETAAFVHCHLAAQLARLAAEKEAVQPLGTADAAAATAEAHAVAARLLADWTLLARNYSAAVYARQCQGSGGSGHWVAPTRRRRLKG